MSKSNMLPCVYNCNKIIHIFLDAWSWNEPNLTKEQLLDLKLLKGGKNIVVVFHVPVFISSRTKQERWSGVCWLSSALLLKRKVCPESAYFTRFPILSILYLTQVEMPFSLCLASHGRVLKLALRNKSMTKLVKRKCLPQQRYLFLPTWTL